MKISCNPKNKEIIQFDIDIQGSYWNREEGTVFYKFTKPGNMLIFNLDTLNILGLLAPAWFEGRVAWAMYKIAQEKNNALKDMSMLFKPIAFKLLENEKDIQRAFPNITTLWIKEIQDIFVKSASIGGATVQASSEYRQFTRTKGGKLKAFRFRYGAYTFLMSEDGLIMSYSDLDADQAYTHFGLLLKTLNTFGAIG